MKKSNTDQNNVEDSCRIYVDDSLPIENKFTTESTVQNIGIECIRQLGGKRQNKLFPNDDGLSGFSAKLE